MGVVADPAALYLDLLKKTLTNSLYADFEQPARKAIDARKYREDGRDQPPFAPTMVGLARLGNVQMLAEHTIAENIPGDFFEAGVWRGGVGILMRGILAATGDRERRVWMADSFAGLPPPDLERYPADSGDPHHKNPKLAVDLDTVRGYFARFGLLDERVVFVKGFFEETLPGCQVKRISLLRLDGDMYGSTIVALRALYDKVSPGGFIIIDDYGYWPACRQAVADFFTERGFSAEINMVDWTGAWWRKPH